ncbi:uncharacterized protein LOC104863298 [Fukomys damarensis]|uniref:uncharacterized protein LOC104863298 n=1 Tax=Fukomys damarensis TaxID=885580 RepID=UPI00053F8AB0|nr:uncharacterized protein LOC104863298 [Fukomys damarensis]
MQPAPLNMPLNVNGWQTREGLKTAREYRFLAFTLSSLSILSTGNCLSVKVTGNLAPALSFPSLFPSNLSVFLSVLPSSCFSPSACDLGWQFLSSERSAPLFLRSALILPTNRRGAPPTDRVFICQSGSQPYTSRCNREGRDKTRARAARVSVSVRARTARQVPRRWLGTLRGKFPVPSHRLLPGAWLSRPGSQQHWALQVAPDIPAPGLAQSHAAAGSARYFLLFFLTCGDSSPPLRVPPRDSLGLTLAQPRVRWPGADRGAAENASAGLSRVHPCGYLPTRCTFAVPASPLLASGHGSACTPAEPPESRRTRLASSVPTG